MFYQSFGPLVTLPTCCMASEITKIISVSLQSSVYVERLRHALRAEFQHHGSKVIPAVSQGKTSSSKTKSDTQPFSLLKVQSTIKRGYLRMSLSIK